MPDPNPAPAPSPAPAPAPAPAPEPAPWHGMTEPEAASYVENKGWKSPADVVKSYQGAEKLIGRSPDSLLVMPRADDPAGLRGVLTKLGLPETPDKYEFAPAEGVPEDKAYSDFARGAFHKAGLLPGQVKEITAAHNAYIKTVLEKQANDYNLSVEADKKALLAEWGGGHERMMNAAKTAAKGLGFNEKMIDSIEKEMGYAGTWKFFAELGKKMGEPGFVDGKGGGGFNNATLTPAEAKSQWEALRNDPTWKAAALDPMHPGHAEAKKKQSTLFAVMYPNG